MKKLKERERNGEQAGARTKVPVEGEDHCLGVNQERRKFAKASRVTSEHSVENPGSPSTCHVSVFPSTRVAALPMHLWFVII